MGTVKKNAADGWSGSLNRPLISVTLDGYERPGPPPELPFHHFTSFYGLETPVEHILDVWEWALAEKRFAGDGFPSLFPNFGPGVLAAFLGCDLHTSVESNTTWYHPRHVRPAADVHLEVDRDNPWLRRVHEVMHAADERFGGRVQVGMTDLGGNLDILSSFRPGEQLLLDLYDCPDEVERLTWEAHACWRECFEHLAAATPHNPGYSAWASILSEPSYYMLQCDFCYMIGPDMFDRFVKPELAATCRYLQNSFYHLDGPGQLPHLDSLLTLR